MGGEFTPNQPPEKTSTPRTLFSILFEKIKSIFQEKIMQRNHNSLSHIVNKESNSWCMAPSEDIEQSSLGEKPSIQPVSYTSLITYYQNNLPKEEIGELFIRERFSAIQEYFKYNQAYFLSISDTNLRLTTGIQERLQKALEQIRELENYAEILAHHETRNANKELYDIERIHRLFRNNILDKDFFKSVEKDLTCITSKLESEIQICTHTYRIQIAQKELQKISTELRDLLCFIAKNAHTSYVTESDISSIHLFFKEISQSS